jgi:uncharacterized protein (DUF2147 family)
LDSEFKGGGSGKARLQISFARGATPLRFWVQCLPAQDAGAERSSAVQRVLGRDLTRKAHQMKTTLVLLFVFLAAVSPCLAADQDIRGVWLNQEQDAKIEIFQCGDKYCGKIVWLKDPLYPPGSKDGTPGTPKVDYKNPDPALRKTPTLGLQIMRDFTFAGNNQWKDGKVYDPKNGKTYSGKITLVSPTQLDLRGFIGVSLLGRTAKWTRAQ